jgi:hypothetical protein
MGRINAMSGKTEEFPRPSGSEDNPLLERMRKLLSISLSLLLIGCWACMLQAQVPPSSAEESSYTGLLSAAARGDAAQIKALIAKGEEPGIRDAYRRTPLHVSAYNGKHETMRALVAAGTDPNALENDRYDIVTIAAVANDVAT